MKNLLIILLIFSLTSCRKAAINPQGTITIFTTSSVKRYVVVVDDMEQGYVKYTTVIPDCGDEKFKIITLTQGVHKVVTLDSAYFWKSEQHIIVFEGSCTNVEVP